MSTIIAGRFEQASDSDRAAAALVNAGFARDDVSVFYVTPAGQHDATAVGGDRHESPGTEDADTAAGKGSAAGGLGAGLVGVAVGVAAGLAAPMVAVAAAGAAAAGAYSGALAGAMGGTESAGAFSVRHAGMLVAVRVPDAGLEEKALAALRDAGASDLERDEGTWEDGQWVDFDPTRPPRLIDGSPHKANAVTY